jgi:hypothetical protein
LLLIKLIKDGYTDAEIFGIIKENKEIIQHPLLSMTHFDISFVSKLDWVDLQNVCRTNKQFASLCNDNQLLRNILYNKNKNIIISPNYDISGAIHDFYSKITSLIDQNYDELPVWVNKELFYNHMTRLIATMAVEKINNDISDNFDALTGDIEISKKIEMNASYISIALYSSELELYDDNDVSDKFDTVPNTIKITKLLTNYISPTVKNTVKLEDPYYKLDYRTYAPAIENLLFI